MKINRKSWHYRLQRRMWNTIPNNLCSYFWKLIWSLIVTSTALTVMAVFILGIVYPLVSYWFSNEYWKSLSIATWMITLTIATIVGSDELKLYYRDKRANEPVKEPSVFVSFVKAKKAKICPLIEFIDE